MIDPVTLAVHIHDSNCNARPRCLAGMFGSNGKLHINIWPICPRTAILDICPM